jgi:8-oxo-dGTP diphosphatase
MKTIEVVAAIIRQGDSILATQRGYGEFEGFWEFPGGKIEEGEAPEVALIREIQEELAVRVEVGEQLCTVRYAYPTFNLVMQCYWCRIVEGTPALLEHKSARWLTAETLIEVEWLPADIEVVAGIQQQLEQQR